MVKSKAPRYQKSALCAENYSIKARHSSLRLLLQLFSFWTFPIFLVVN